MMENLYADQDAQARTLFSITVFLMIKLAIHVMMYITNKHNSENSGHCLCLLFSKQCSSFDVCCQLHV